MHIIILLFILPQILTLKGVRKCPPTTKTIPALTSSHLGVVDEHGNWNLMEEVKLVRNNRIGTIPHIGKEFKITFQFKATSYNKKTNSILHFTVGGNSGPVGTRIPGVWVTKAKSFYLAFGLNKKGNSAHYVQEIPPLNTWVEMEFSQTLESEGYVYREKINGTEVRKVENKRPLDFYKVKVYASDPWHTSQSGSVRNIEVKTQNFGTTLPPVAEENHDWSHLGEIKLFRNNLIGIIPHIGKTFQITYQFKPTSYNKLTWVNLILLTDGSMYGKMGERLPAVFINEGKKIFSYFALNGNGRSKRKISDSTPTNTWVEMEFSQTLEYGRYIYKEKINGKEVRRVENKTPLDFYHVKVYASNPKSPTQPGFIRNFKVNTQNFADLLPPADIQIDWSHVNEVKLVRDNLIGTVPFIGKEFKITFQFKATEYKTNQWTSVLHFTGVDQKDIGIIGNRIPGVWIRNGQEFHLTFGLNGEHNSINDVPELPPLNTWIQMEFSQTLEDEGYIYKEIINGKEVRKVVNKTPMDFYRVKVYASDPWYAAQPGSVANIQVEQGGEDLDDKLTEMLEKYGRQINRY